MTNKELFEKVKHHLLTQNKKAEEEIVVYDRTIRACRYRTRHGLKCAIGILIPDDRYQPEFEGRNCSYPAITEAAGLEDHNFPLVRYLQNIHDESPVSEWKERLEHLADRLNLN
jgi:hypothetical protein